MRMRRATNKRSCHAALPRAKGSCALAYQTRQWGSPLAQTRGKRAQLLRSRTQAQHARQKAAAKGQASPGTRHRAMSACKNTAASRQLAVRKRHCKSEVCSCACTLRAPAPHGAVVRLRLNKKAPQELGIVHHVPVAPLPQRGKLLPCVRQCNFEMRTHVAKLQS